jgi:hypothetical protein
MVTTAAPTSDLLRDACVNLDRAENVSIIEVAVIA